MSLEEEPRKFRISFLRPQHYTQLVSAMESAICAEIEAEHGQESQMQTLLREQYVREALESGAYDDLIRTSNTREQSRYRDDCDLSR